MSETEIALARAYLDAAGHDAIGALIRSVRDLARVRRMLAGEQNPARWADASGRHAVATAASLQIEAAA